MKLLTVVRLTLAAILSVAAVSTLSARKKTPMKVMSYNLRYTNKIDTGVNTWAMRRQPSFDMIRDERPDIIGFQEPRPDQMKDLKEGLGDVYGYYSAVEAGVEPRKSGYVAIMYLKDRFNLLDKGHFWLSPTPDVPSKPEWGAQDRQYRMTVWVKLFDKKAGRDVYFFTTHLPYKFPDNDARAACSALNVERMKKIAGQKSAVFITGDMNASWAKSDTCRRSVAPYFRWMKGARETARVLTPDICSYNGFGTAENVPSWNLDHIFYRNIRPKEFDVITTDKYGVRYISDHYPITLTLEY